MELGTSIFPPPPPSSSSSSSSTPPFLHSLLNPHPHLKLPPFLHPSSPTPCLHSHTILDSHLFPGSDQQHKAHFFHVLDTPSPSPPPPTSERTQKKEIFDCVIVGAGISGLCTAQALATKHASDLSKVLVTEARDRVGGSIATVQRDGYLWEEGPNSFETSDPILEMVVDTGLKDELVLVDPTAPRFVYWQGRLRPIPRGLTDLPFFDLLSAQGKFRAGLGALGIRHPSPGYEESVEEFVHRNLGTEVFERLVEPLCSGVYAGDPVKLSMKAAFGRVWRLEEMGGSIIGGTFKLIQEEKKSLAPPRVLRLPKLKGRTVGSFKKGLITLPKAIAEKLGSSIKLNWKLESMQVASGGGYELVYNTPEGLKSVLTKSVLLTVPSYVASNILRPLSQTAADSLAKLSYPPMASVTFSYPKSSIRKGQLVNGKLKGIGQLHPRNQGIQSLETIYSSSLFPGRVPDGQVLLLNYIGGATNPGIINMTKDELVSQVDTDLRKMLIKPDAPTPKVLSVRMWPRAIPQFDVGHFDILNDTRKALDTAGLGGLFIGGNYAVGVTLGCCVKGAYECAESISRFSKTFQL